jgi:hypothetical protein
VDAKFDSLTPVHPTELGALQLSCSNVLASMNNIVALAATLETDLGKLISYITVGPPGHFATDLQTATRIKNDCTAARVRVVQTQGALANPSISNRRLRTITPTLNGYASSCVRWDADLQDIQGRVNPLMIQHQAGLRRGKTIEISN